MLSVLIGMVSTANYSPAQVGPKPLHPAAVGWDQNPDTLLISYRDIWGEFANQDPVPLIRVFGDGRVLIHYPAYTPRAGEYEVWLQAAELEGLLLSLLTRDLASFEPAKVSREKQLAVLRGWEAALDAGLLPELFMVADDSTSVFQFHVTDYWPEGSALSSGTVSKSISWLGLGTDADRFPELTSIQQLRAAEVELRALLERDDLRRVQ